MALSGVVAYQGIRLVFVRVLETTAPAAAAAPAVAASAAAAAADMGFNFHRALCPPLNVSF